MSYYWSCKTERINYKASCITKFYFCSRADTLIKIEFTPSGVYRECERCKKCIVTEKLEINNKIFYLESADFNSELFYALELSGIKIKSDNYDNNN